MIEGEHDRGCRADDNPVQYFLRNPGSGRRVAAIGLKRGWNRRPSMSCVGSMGEATRGQVLLDGLAPQAQSLIRHKVAVSPQENAIPTDPDEVKGTSLFQAIIHSP